MGRAGLHRACLIILTGLVIQLALGMILNLYITIPAADARASYLREIETAPGILTAHVLVALLLLAIAVILLLRAIALRDVAVIAPVATGLAALLGAFAAGEAFVRNGEIGASLSMATLTGVALLCYIYLQAIIIRQRSPVRDGRHGPRSPGGRGTPPPGLASGCACLAILQSDNHAKARKAAFWTPSGLFAARERPAAPGPPPCRATLSDAGGMYVCAC